jgi:hypothetical protein
MVTKTAKERTSEKRSETKTKSTRVVLVTSDFAAEGTIRHQSSQCLLDILTNGISVSSARNVRQVVPLSDVSVLRPGSEAEHKASLRVKKTEVLFVAEISNGQVQMTAKTKPAPKKSRKKEPVMAKVRISGHNLVGKMDESIRQAWTDASDSRDCFVSLAEVQIMPKLPNGRWQFRSAVVNRDRVDDVSEAKITPPSVEMTLVRITRYTEKVEADSPVDLPDLESHAPEAQVQDV